MNQKSVVKKIALKGFTLVELIIVVSLLSFMTALTMPFAISQVSNTNVFGDIRILAGDIFESQQNSYTYKNIDSLTNISKCYGVDLTPLVANKTYNVVDGNWVKLVTTYAINTTANNATTINGTNVSVGIVVGDLVSLSSSPAVYAKVLTVPNANSFTVNRALGNGTSQTVSEYTTSAVTQCINRSLVPKKLSQRMVVTSAVPEIFFTPGSFRPLPSVPLSGSLNFSGDILNASSGGNFTNQLQINDPIHLITGGVTYPLTIKIVSDNSNATVTEGQAINVFPDNVYKFSNEVITFASVGSSNINYKIFVNNEGSISYQRI